MTTYIGTSWKMNKTTAEARRYARQLNRHAQPVGVQTFVIPPYTAIQAVRDELDPATNVWIGAQNAHWATSGAYTGEISMGMVKDVGASLVELGHFERRAMFNETDRAVALKVAAAIEADLTPLVCIGEDAETRERGEAMTQLVRQAEAVMDGISTKMRERVLLAYEPQWSIGERGTPASPEIVGDAAAALRESLSVRGILYGGSVDLGNARDYLTINGLDGLFVGRSAWRAEDLLTLVDLAASLTNGTLGDVS